MKPLRLIMSGWGPFKDTQSIDFTSLKDGGLFLITGPTGAGKTTIFDGISFALYGEVSGSIREKDSLRSDHALADTVTKVELWFCHRGEEYHVVRKPRYTREKLRGGGLTTENESGELYQGAILMATGTHQVTERVSTLLGVDYRQFKQISMIAQGEFQQLLMASSKERTLIFRDIFQTGLYDTIRQVLGQRVKMLTGQLEEQKHRMEEVTAGLRMSDENWDTLCASKNRNYTKIMEHITLDLAEKSSIREGLLTKQAVLDSEHKGLVERRGQAKNQNDLIDQYEAKCKRLTQLKEELDRVTEHGIQLKIKEKELPAMEQEQEKTTQALQILEGQWEQAKQWQQAQAELKRFQQQYLELDACAKQKKLEYEHLEDVHKKAAAGILAQSLLPGMPCPVCGSTEHPKKALLETEIPNEAKLKALKNEAEKHQNLAAKAQEQAASSLGALLQMEQGLGEWKEELKADGATGIKQMQDKVEGLRTKLNQQKKAIVSLKETCQKNQIEEERKRSAYQQAKEDLRKPENLERQEISELSRQIQELELTRSQISKELEQIQTILSVNQSGHQKLNEHLAARQKLEQEYGVLGGLERAASGSNDRKLVLEQYVLSVYFEDILRAANLRLLAMTGNRYELYRQEESRDKRMKEGMEIQVLDQYTGKRRSVKTLSGGECFKAALSLALGTSDVVQSYAGGIQVETLFVDEGFGSLDTESIGQAVDILAGLQGGQRMIGIISHVEELRERIGDQILVEKNNNGSSIRSNFLVYS